MDAQERQPGPSVEKLARALPSLAGLGFFELLSLLERLDVRAREGEDEPPLALLRLKHDASLAFNAGDVSSLRLLEGAPPTLELTTTFLGLTGSATPLPAYFAEEATGDEPVAINARDFLDIFHHRLLSILFHGVAKYRPTYRADSEAADEWTDRLLALSGIDREQDVPQLPPALLLRLVPLLVDRTRSARGLEIALEEALAFALPEARPRVRVEQFVGTWVDLAEDDRCALGRRNCRLGRNAPLGGRSFARGAALLLHVSGIGAEEHRELASPRLRELVGRVVTLIARDPVEWQLVAELAHEARPRLRLGRAPGSSLGIDSWLGATSSRASPVPPRLPRSLEPSCALTPSTSSAA